MRKVLFLDVDGVLNDVDDHARDEIRYENLKALWWLLIMVDNCEIVISSSWRLGNIFTLLRSISKACEFEFEPSDIYHSVVNRIIDTTPPSYTFRPRGLEIQEWLDTDEFEGRIAIIDDQGDMCNLTDHLFQTDKNAGLTKELASLVVKHLNDGPVVKFPTPAQPAGTTAPSQEPVP